MKHKIHNGFTLIELLTVLAIIGIIVTFAVPQYSKFKAKAYDLKAQNDARNIALGEESYYMDNDAYLSCQNDSCTELPGVSAISKGVTVRAQVNLDSIMITSRHEKGSKEYTWDSSKGGFIE